ncbi:MAG: magnesium chelatase, partial [Clostridia bacterium]|nr:magnesium chelatase [Clostridia bacterium]
QTAIKNSGIQLLSKKIIVNLSPANIRKEGSMFDLPMAVGVLIATSNINNKKISELLKDTIFVGELSLDGKINKISGILPICIEAKKHGINRIILPKSNLSEASIVTNLEIIPFDNLQDLILYLNGNLISEPEKVELQNNNNTVYDIDFSEVKGQDNVKRALEISAARWA